MSIDARFSIIPGWIVTDPRLRGRDLQVLCLLGRHTDRFGWCRRSQVKMADQLGCARSTVQASLDRLGEIGVVEKHVQDSVDGRDSAHAYRVIYDAPPPSGYAFDAWGAEELEDFIPFVPVENGTPPADISAPPAGPESAPPAGPGSAPINDPYLTTQVKREEREPARDGWGSERVKNPNVAQRSEMPGTAEFQKRVQRFLSGDGYSAGEWPLWAKGASFDYHEKQFARLTEEDRRQAEVNRDAVLSKWRREGIPDGKIMGPGNYFKGRVWETLSDRDRTHATELAQRKAGKPNIGKPDNFVPAFGPVHSAAWLRVLLAGPDKADLAPANGIWLRNTIRMAWPSLERFMLISDQQKGVIASDLDFSASRQMVFVPFDTDRFAEWRHAFRERGWPDLPSPNGMTGLYLPAGGPSSLDNFQNSGVTNDAA